MDKSNEMRVFIEAMRRGSFSAAARHLGLSPSAVSKLLSGLEARLGVRLLNRTTRTLSLTEAGALYFERCVEIIDDIESAENAITGLARLPTGLLRINSTPGFAKHQLLQLMAEFQARYPDLSLDFQLTGQAVDLVKEGVDVAIRLGSLKDSSLVRRKLGESRRLVCASPDYLKVHGKPKTPSDLRNHNCLRLTTSESFNQWRFTGKRGSERIDVTGRFVTDNVDALHAYALLGGGIARLSTFMIGRDVAQGRLLPLLTQYRVDAQQIHAVYPHRKHLPAKVKVFLDFLSAKFAPAPPWD